MANDTDTVPLITWYKFGLRSSLHEERTALCELLTRDSLYPEFSSSQKVGGRDGDLGVESVDYTLFFGGWCNGANDGRSAAIYHVTVDNTNGQCDFLSVILQPRYDRGFKDFLDVFFKIRDFAPRHVYLPSETTVAGFRTFTSWIDTIVKPDMKLFYKK